MPGCNVMFIQHPVAQDALAEQISPASGFIQIIYVLANCIHPVLESVLDTSNRQVSTIAMQVTADNCKATSTVLQQAQVALALVEQVLFYRCQRQIQIQASQHGRVAVYLHAGVELMYIGSNSRRTHAEEDPLDFISQFFHHITDQIQITAMTDASGPTDTRLTASTPLTGKPMPPFDRQPVLNDPNIVMQTRECISQTIRRNDKAINEAQPLA